MKLMQKKGIIILTVLLLSALGLSGYLYNELNIYKANPQKAAEEETQLLVRNVGQLVALPGDEVPTVATVADPEKLKDQPFFANAKKGDKVLIYTDARKAYLYDPILKRVIEIAPLNIGEGANAAAAATAGN